MRMSGILTVCIVVTCSIMGQSTGQASSNPITVHFFPNTSESNFAHVYEESSIGTMIGLIEVKGTEDSSTVQCISTNERFGLVQRSEDSYYSLEVFARLDREIQSTYTVPVTCEAPETRATLEVTVELLDINDNAPVFSKTQYNFSVPENTALGTIIGQVSAIDADFQQNAEIHYTIWSQTYNFISIDSTTGVLALSRVLDRESTSSIRLVVAASDNGIPQMSTSAVVAIQVQDVNDNAPISAKAEYTFNVVEGSSAGTLVGQIQVTDMDSGENGQVHLSIQSTKENGVFAINQFDIVTAVDLSFSHVGCHNLTLLATDHGVVPLSSRIPVRICVASVIG